MTAATPAADPEIEAFTLLERQLGQLLTAPLPETVAALAEYNEQVSNFEDATNQWLESYSDSTPHLERAWHHIDQAWGRYNHALHSEPMRQACRRHALSWWQHLRPGCEPDETVEIFAVEHRYYFGHSFELLTLLEQHSRWSRRGGHRNFRHIAVAPRWVRGLFDALTDYTTSSGHLYQDLDHATYETAAALWLADTEGGAYTSFDSALAASEALNC
jgi:hypothetical protein